jgi:transcriptional regulator with XRE-family HTH domain
MKMTWDAEKIRGLRLRMGWSQTDLARRLQTESKTVIEWEIGLVEPAVEFTQELDLLFKQADSSADQLSCDSLCEIEFEESDATQIDTTSIRRKFFSN